MGKVSISQHPLIKTKISILREQTTESKQFRDLVNEVSLLLGYEAMQDLELTVVENMAGMLSPFTGYKVKSQVAFVPILRAGLGMINGILDLFPSATVYHLGLYRQKAFAASANQPAYISIILDPMIATGGSAIAAIDLLKDWGCRRIKLVGICASSCGIERITSAHPDVDICVGVVDEQLDTNGYIIPGFGDAGDRLFKTL